MDRRTFLKATAATATAAIPFAALNARVQTRSKPQGVGYGPIAPVLDETTGLPLIALPDGFRYLSFGWTSDLMANGQPTPSSHDGMAAFDAGGGRVRLVRNHERGAGTAFSSFAYDAGAGGGTTTLEFDGKAGALIQSRDSMSGTIRNCAGGLTPWRTWLTCEETTLFTTMPHGYIFEVPENGYSDAVPIRAMGRFSHEAVAVDPVTGYIYETEDAGLMSGFYRYAPSKRNRPSEGGTLSMLKVKTATLANLGAGFPNGASFGVEWVEIAQPDDTSSTMPGNFVWAQGRALGAATFARLEGCWYGNDRKIYVVSTNGGAAGQGQIWVYDPKDEIITLLFESPGGSVLNALTTSRSAREEASCSARTAAAKSSSTASRWTARSSSSRATTSYSTASETGSLATSADRSGRVPATAPMASGCLPTFRVLASPSRSPGPGAPALSDNRGYCG